VAAGRVLYLALPPSLLRVNPGAISIPLDPAVRSEVLAPEPTAAEARWLRDQLGNLEGGPAWP
jgi:hypothetical protein